MGCLGDLGRLGRSIICDAIWLRAVFRSFTSDVKLARADFSERVSTHAVTHGTTTGAVERVIAFTVTDFFKVSERPAQRR